MLVFYFAYLDLRCTTQDEVLEAIEKIKNNYPKATFNPLTKQEGIILPMERPPSGTAVNYSDTEVKQNDASLQQEITSNIYFNLLEKIYNNKLDIGYVCI